MGLTMATILPSTTDEPTLHMSGEITVLKPCGGGTLDFTQLQWHDLAAFDLWLAKVVAAREALQPKTAPTDPYEVMEIQLLPVDRCCDTCHFNDNALPKEDDPCGLCVDDDRAGWDAK